MFNQTLEKEVMVINAQRITFQELWETDIDYLYEEYDLIFDENEDTQSITDEDWMVF